MPTKTPARRWGGLVIAMLAIGLVWLVVLPFVTSQPSVSEHIATQKRMGVDPSAMFYSELEIAPGIAHHVERLHDSHSNKFWSTAQRNETAEFGRPQSD